MQVCLSAVSALMLGSVTGLQADIARSQTQFTGLQADIARSQTQFTPKVLQKHKTAQQVILRDLFCGPNYYQN
jgi:hypothetical protein